MKHSWLPLFVGVATIGLCAILLGQEPDRGNAPVITPAEVAMEGAPGVALRGRAVVRCETPFEVLGVTSSHKSIETIVSPLPGAEGRAVSVDIEVAGGVPPGRLSVRVVLTTSNKTNPTIAIPILVWVHQ